MKKFIVSMLLAATLLTLTACSTKANTSAQTRTDLTQEHVKGLYNGMKRTDVEGLIGTHDSNLSSRETTHLYSLADGSTAVLRYVGDELKGAFIRGKDDVEDVIFNGFDRIDGENGNYNTDDGKVIGNDETNMSDDDNLETNMSTIETLE